MVSCLELPTLQTKPMLFSTFLMWLLADLFEDLPEAGDLDKPKLVFFLDEAHLLFNGASKAFLDAITTTVRLIRSKGVGIFFVTQTPKDVPADVLGQLANRVQHALRAYTPEDAKALRATVSTFPTSDYDLEETLTTAGIGEAVITVLNEKGAPTPVALTRLRAPESVMGPSTDALISSTVAASALLPKYGTAVDNISAYEKITADRGGHASAAPTGPAAGTAHPGGAKDAGAQDGGLDPTAIDAEARRIEEEILAVPAAVQRRRRDARCKRPRAAGPGRRSRRPEVAAGSAVISRAPSAEASRAWPDRWGPNLAGNCSAASSVLPRNAAAARDKHGPASHRVVLSRCPDRRPAMLRVTDAGCDTGNPVGCR